MSHGIVRIPCIAVRREATEQSEMTSQLLFGEIFEILDSGNGWLQVSNEFDGYEGWISRTGVGLLDQEELGSYRAYDQFIQAEAFMGLQKAAGEEPMMVPAGSVLYFKPENPSRIYCIDTFRTEKPFKEQQQELKQSIVSTAKKFLNIPYLWGGRSTYGTDCSGLVQTVFRIQGIHIARDTSDQVKQGKALNMLPEAETGDLLFFDNEEGEIVHVGLLLEAGSILHASGMVRIDPVDHQGIYSKEMKRYTHKLRVIKRII